MKPNNYFVRVAIMAAFVFVSLSTSFGYQVTGKIISDQSGEPIAFVNVFMANTTYGTLTNKDGEFTLNIPSPGLYQIIAQHLSYATYVSDVNLTSETLHLTIRLTQKHLELDPVTIAAKDPYREKNQVQFKNAFLGETPNSGKIILENPKCIHFYRGVKNKVLSTRRDTDYVSLGFIPSYLKAFSDSFVIIRNESLGYILKYKLDYFFQDHSLISFYGYPLFEDLSGVSKNKKRLNARRVQAYYGSKMHFFRSLYSNTLEQEGFQVYRLMEKPRDTIQTFPDKINYKDYGILGDMASAKENRLVQTDEKIDLAFHLRFDSTTKIKILEYYEPFEVRYVEASEDKDYVRSEKAHAGIERKNDQQVSIVVLKQGKILVSKNGSYARIKDVTFGGYFGWKRIADLLPFDFDLKQTLLK